MLRCKLVHERYGAASMITEALAARPRARHHLAVAFVAVAVVFAGFAPTFYLNSYFEQRPLDALRIAHGVVFSLWPLLLILQVLLAKLGRPDLHRRLGPIGAVLAAAMVVLGVALAVHAGRSGFLTPGLPPAPIFLAMPIFDMAVFTTLVSAAVALRNSRADHWRLMILATLSLLPAAFGRLPVPGIGDPIVKAFAPAIALLLICVVHDVMISRYLHRAWLWGGLWFVLSVPLRLVVAGTAAWQRFAGWLIGA
jgi:hypothetical protein